MKTLFMSLMLFGSCARDSVADKINGNTPLPPGGAASLVEHVAYWASGLASLAILTSIIFLWTNPKKGQQLICIALSVLVGAQVMIWIAAHLFWIGLITLVCGLGYIAYRHREQIEDILDGDDAKVEASPLERNT